MLFNHLLSRKLGGKWVLRIEDTDRTRLVPGAVQSLLATLDWCSLDYDFGQFNADRLLTALTTSAGPGRNDSNTSYVQSERLEIYNNHLLPLIKVRRCFARPVVTLTYCYRRTKRIAASAAPNDSMPSASRLNSIELPPTTDTVCISRLPKCRASSIATSLIPSDTR